MNAWFFDVLLEKVDSMANQLLALRAQAKELGEKVEATNVSVIEATRALQALRDAYDTATLPDAGVDPAAAAEMGAVLTAAISKIEAQAKVLNSVVTSTALPAVTPPKTGP